MPQLNRLFKRLFAILLGASLWTGNAWANPLAEMAGNWSGSGWARQTAGGPQEPLRCRIENKFNTATSRLKVRGACAVPGRRFDVNGALNGSDPERLRGFFRNPEGAGRAELSGQINEDAAVFAFQVTVPKTGEKISQVVSWKVTEAGLSFRAMDRTTREITAELTFAR